MFASEQEKSKRMSHCNSCSELKQTIAGKQCGNCKCLVALKVVILSQKCPKRIW